MAAAPTEPVIGGSGRLFKDGTWDRAAVRTRAAIGSGTLEIQTMAIDEARVSEFTERLQERDRVIRESWIRAMEARIVRDSLQKCHRIEGVNSLENCKDLAEKYTQMLKDNRVQGFKNIDV